MDYETLKQNFAEEIATGKEFEEIVGDYVDSFLCTPEQATQLREHFARSVNASAPPSPTESGDQFGDDGGVSPSSPALCKGHVGVASLVTQVTRTPPPASTTPTLQIDWGEIKPGVPLVPKFTIKDVHQPLLYLKIDLIGLQQIPKLTKTKNEWYFHQSLKIDHPGQYLCQITVIDRMPDEPDPRYYLADFRIDVTDPKQAGQRRKITIQADGNLAANLDRFGKDADIEIVGGNVTLNARDESILDKRDQASNNVEIDSETTIPFLSDTDAARKVPYIAVLDAPKQIFPLTMTESGTSGTKCYIFISRRLVFGRDVPDQNIWNDVPLVILPGTPEAKDRAEEFSLLNGLFSREHARLEVDQGNICLVPVSPSGTILDNQLLPQGSELLFDRDASSAAAPRCVLFAKILSMQLTPHYETFFEKVLRNNLPSMFPDDLLYGLYSVDSSFTGVTSVRIEPDRYFKQKPYADVILKRLQSTPLAESGWWKKWFSNTDNTNPHHGTHEYWFVSRFVTLGRDHCNKIRLESRQWDDVRLRIVFLNNSLYIENISLNTVVEFGLGDDCRPLSPFRPQPLCPGAFVRKGNAVVRFE